jgi:hypothetical protein
MVTELCQHSSTINSTLFSYGYMLWVPKGYHIYFVVGVACSNCYNWLMENHLQKSSGIGGTNGPYAAHLVSVCEAAIRCISVEHLDFQTYSIFLHSVQEFEAWAFLIGGSRIVKPCIGCCRLSYSGGKGNWPWEHKELHLTMRNKNNVDAHGSWSLV